MIAVDTNILVNFHRRDYPFHKQALNVITELAEGSAPWAIPWPCIHEMIAVITHSKIFKIPTSIENAFLLVEALMESPSLVMLAESDLHLSTLKLLATKGKINGPMVHDARIAAICLDNGVKMLYTADRDFSRFTQLKTRNPLV